MIYEYNCKRHGTFEVDKSMAEASREEYCPNCKETAQRIFHPAAVTYHCDGFHATDYGRGNHTGTKADALNRAWSEYYGEAPPPPATDIPKNSSEPV